MSRLRCAIYTRVSTEEGLDQVFNSLDAQRESCEAFIKSQAAEGWTCPKARYDDGGFSGGTMERPGLKALLGDIESSRVNVVVVYKVDRLTRSLADFARLVDLFDAQGVSFVSVTQQFNTTSSMGRLTLNVLLSFAQFEREVTAERIRDKIAASKKKGMWMGGVVPLGYEAVDRRLAIEESEAKTVRALFDLYLTYANVRLVKQEADRLGLRTKARKPNNGKRQGGERFTRGHIYKLLGNRIYVGQIVHKGVSYPGEHQPIIEHETWERVQEQLNKNAVARRHGSNSKTPSLLTGLLRDEDGERLTTSHSNNHGRRYRYYISKPAIDKTSNAGDRWRLPASQIESVVLDGIADLLRDGLRLSKAMRLTGRQMRTQLVLAASLGSRLPQSGPGDQRTFLLDSVDRINVQEKRVTIILCIESLRGMLPGGDGKSKRTPKSKATFELVIPVTFKRRGIEMKLVLTDDRKRQPLPDPKLITAIARAQRWFTEIKDGKFRSVSELAKRHGLDQGDVSRILRLAFLSPDIIEAILEGRQPTEWTAAGLKRIADLPVCWQDQRRVLGFA